MKLGDNMKEKILTLEKNLFKLEYISNKEWLEKIIDNNFSECGKSGYLFYKKDTIESLLECTEDRPIKIYNYEYKKIDEKTYLVHYITKSQDKIYYRTSIWINNLELKLLYHQATEFHEKIDLIEY